MADYFSNVFLDDKGEIITSEHGYPYTTSIEAMGEAIKYELEYGWKYLATLTNGVHSANFRKEIDQEREERIQKSEDDLRYGSYEQQVANTYNAIIR